MLKYGIYVKDDGVNTGAKVTQIETASTEDANKGIYKEISQFDHIGCEDLRTFNDAEFESIIPEG